MVVERLFKIGKAALNAGTKEAEKQLSEVEKELKEKAKSREPPRPQRNKELEEAFKSINVPYGSSFEECKTAYRKEARKYHSDLYNKDPEKKETAEKIMRILNGAYEVIKKHYGKK